MTIEFTRESMQTVQEVLAADQGAPPPEPYVGHSTRPMGTDPISVERFISADYQRLEYERMWSRVWQWACNKEDIANVGDHTVYDIGDRSVLLVRAAPDEIKAYHNACLHRGTQLKQGCGTSKNFRCPFHGWTWNLDGSLDRIPCRWDFPQLRDEDLSLREVRCEAWSQFVFINFDDDAEPLLNSLDVIPEHFKHFPMDDKYTTGWVEKVIPANWKVTMEAFLESYHEVATHPQLLEWTGDANTQYDLWERSSRLFTLTGVNSPHLGKLDDADIYAAAVDFFTATAPGSVSSELPEGKTVRQATAELTRAMMAQALGVDWSAESDTLVMDSAQYHVFPNWCPWSGLAQALQYRFRPNGDDPHSSIFEVRVMLPLGPGQPRPPAPTKHVLQPGESWTNAPELMGFCAIMDQDEANLVAIQRGLRATKETGVRYSEYQESRIRLFHGILDDYMNEPVQSNAHKH